MEARKQSSSPWMPSLGNQGLGICRVSCTSGSSGFSTKLTTWRFSSICMMPSSLTSRRPLAMVATVRSASFSICWAMILRKSIR